MFENDKKNELSNFSTNMSRQKFPPAPHLTPLSSTCWDQKGVNSDRQIMQKSTKIIYLKEKVTNLTICREDWKNPWKTFSGSRERSANVGKENPSKNLFL